MATIRKVHHEITLAAFVRNPDGTRSIIDIVETDFHNASYREDAERLYADVLEKYRSRP